MTNWEIETVRERVREAERRGVRVIPIPSLVRRINPLRDLQALVSFWWLMRHEKPAIVHTHCSKAGLLGRWAAKMAGVPLNVHTPHGHVFYGHFGPAVSRFFLVLEKITARITDAMIALTEGERDDYIRLAVATPEKVMTIHSGVEIRGFENVNIDVREKKAALGLHPEFPVVASVGWLLPVKGPLYLLRAMRQVWKMGQEATLIFVGKGELEGALKEEASKMGVSDKVKFLGWRDDVPEIMQLLDILVLPSLNEGMGRVLVEAMAAGKPVVGSRLGGIKDLIKEGENGYAVEPGDVDGLAEAIRLLLADEEKRVEMGKKGRAMAEAYSVEKMIEKIDDLYACLLQRSVRG